MFAYLTLWDKMSTCLAFFTTTDDTYLGTELVGHVDVVDSLAFGGVPRFRTRRWWRRIWWWEGPIATRTYDARGTTPARQWHRPVLTPSGHRHPIQKYSLPLLVVCCSHIVQNSSSSFFLPSWESERSKSNNPYDLTSFQDQVVATLV